MKKNILYSKFHILDNNKGQISLIVLTVMAVALTLGLSMSRRSVTDVSISQKEQESAKAFSAAEAGIEEALRQLNQGQTDVSISGSDLGVDSVNVDVTELGGEAEYTYPQEYVRSGESAVIWLREHNQDGTIDFANGYDGATITVCWDENAAMEITLFYEDNGGNYRIRRFARDPDINNSRGGNGFEAPNQTNSCTDFDTSHTVDIPALGTGLFLVVKPFYEQTPIGVLGTEGLPSQGYEIYSTAQVEESSENENISRRIRVFRSWDILPDSLFNVLFSGTGISTN